MEKIAAIYPDFQVIMAEKILEPQKSNNCSSEAVENLVFKIIGHRLD